MSEYIALPVTFFALLGLMLPDLPLKFLKYIGGKFHG